jgi:hypothetical protein
MSYYEQKMRPVHFVFIHEDDYEWCFQNTVEDGECHECGVKVGQVWCQMGDTDGCHWYNYWQVDEDAEVIFCEDCYAELTAEVV